MKKVLIYVRERKLAPVGGPNGYVYNLLQGLSETGGGGIAFSCLPGGPRAAKGVLGSGRAICGRLRRYGFSRRAAVDLSPYDAVHFHATADLYGARGSLERYGGKVLLTSHTPTMPCREIYEGFTAFERKVLGWFYRRRLPRVDAYAFDRADYLLFPCKEAEEPYDHEWPGYAEVHARNRGKYCYLPSGTAPRIARASRQEVRGRCGVPEDAFVVSYVGRHHAVKGYDILRAIGETLLNRAPKVYFLVAGREGPLYPLNHERWIEVGWTDDPGSLISASDAFILPNRETYFDLVLLEALSLGQIVLASRTGGNRYFERFGEAGILLYGSVGEALEKIDMLRRMPEPERERLRRANAALYRRHFTNAIFAGNYVRLLERILGLPEKGGEVDACLN